MASMEDLSVLWLHTLPPGMHPAVEDSDGVIPGGMQILSWRNWLYTWAWWCWLATGDRVSSGLKNSCWGPGHWCSLLCVFSLPLAMHPAVKARGGAQAGDMQGHHHRGWLEVGVVVPARDRRQGLIQACKQLQGPWRSMCYTLLRACVHYSEGW